MANIDIDLGARLLKATAIHNSHKSGTTSVLQLEIDGYDGRSTLRLHFATEDSLRAAAAGLAGVSVQHTEGAN